MSNFLLSRGFLGRHMLAGTVSSAGVIVVDYPEMSSDMAVVIYDSAGQKQTIIGGDIGESPLVSMEFEIVTTGCGAFTMVLDRNNSLGLSYNQRIDIFLFGNQVPWYSGYVVTRPLPGTTADTYAYTGFGFFNQLEKVLVNKVYENAEISSIVNDLMTSLIEPKTDIVYKATKIYATDYTASKIRFDQQNAKDVLKTLAEFATDYVYGVDERREFFFRPLNRLINENSRFWAGHHVTKFLPEEDINSVINFFYVKYGKLDSGGQNIYPDPFFDSASQEAYGLREGEPQSMPSAIEDADVVRWGQSRLDVLKKPKRTAEVDGFAADVVRRNIKPDGMARITTADGLYSYEYPIKSVKYKISGDGIVMSMQLGDYSPRLDHYVAQLIADAKNAELLQQLNNVQLSGGDV